MQHVMSIIWKFTQTTFQRSSAEWFKNEVMFFIVFINELLFRVEANRTLNWMKNAIEKCNNQIRTMSGYMTSSKSLS